jgi:hypothetical protein
VARYDLEKDHVASLLLGRADNKSVSGGDQKAGEEGVDAADAKMEEGLRELGGLGDVDVGDVGGEEELGGGWVRSWRRRMHAFSF